LQRAEELYSGLCAENLGDEHLWTAMFRIYDRTGDPVGLESAVRRYRNAQIQLGAADVADVDRLPLPHSLDRVVNEIRSRIGTRATEPSRLNAKRHTTDLFGRDRWAPARDMDASVGNAHNV